MNIETYYDKLEGNEEIKYQVYLTLMHTPMSVPQIMGKFKVNRSNAQSMVRILIDGGHLDFSTGMNLESGRKVKIYHFTGLEYTKKTRADFIEYVSHQYQKPAKPIKKESWYNPHAVVYRLLDRPKQAPSPKIKGKNLYGGIQSSFNMMEFAS